MNNILNLVFDNWDEFGNPLPNLNHLNKKLGYGGIQMALHFYETDQTRYKKKYCNLSDIHPDENYYYIVSHYCSYDNLFNENEWQLSEKVEYYIKNKNLKVIFLSEHESYMNFSIDLENLLNLIKKKQLNPKQFYVINNNSLINEINNNTSINLYKSDFLLSQFAISLNENLYKIPFKEDKQFLFLCQNRRPKKHRIALLALLKNNQLLDSGLIDWSLPYGLMKHSLLDAYGHQNFIDCSNDEKLLHSYYEICSKPKLGFYEMDKDWFNHPNYYLHFLHIECKCFENSYINIVTESHYEIKDVHITEKSYKPFYFYQFPIFLASYRHVSKLKKEHPNLDLFEDIINYDYDLEIDDTKRLYMVLDEIVRLSKLKKEIHSYYISNKEKFIKNHKYISKYGVIHSAEKYFYNLI